jgi:hypothetical protein
MTGAELERSIARNLRDKNLIPNAPITVRVVEARPVGTQAAVPGEDAGRAPEPRQSTDAAAVAGGASDAARAVRDMSAAQIGMIDQQMRQLQVDRAALQDQLAALRAKGLADEHPDVRLIRDRLGIMDRSIEQRARAWRDLQLKIGQAKAAVDRREDQIPAGARAAVGGVQLDLVNLANSMVDAGGAVRLAKVNYDVQAQLSKGGGGSNLELETAKANLETAAKRLNLLRSIAEVALQSAQDDFRRAKAMYEKGVGDQQSLSEATSKVKMLELIVAGAQ